MTKFSLYNSISLFRYQGCTTVDTDGKEWCAFGIHPGQEYSEGAWGWCTESNNEQPISPHGKHGYGSQETAFRRCKIPFQYKGLTYSQCATVDHTGPWCYFDDNNPKAWGNC